MIVRYNRYGYPTPPTPTLQSKVFWQYFSETLFGTLRRCISVFLVPYGAHIHQQ